MSADLLSGKLDHVAQVAKRRTGKRPSPATIFRWVKKGLRGGKVKLAAKFHSGYWATTEAAFDKFLDDQTAAAFASQSASIDDETLQAEGLL